MKKRFSPYGVICSLCLVVLGIAFPSVQAQIAPAKPGLSNYDKRREGARNFNLPTDRQGAFQKLKAEVPGLQVSVDPILRSPHYVAASDGFLSSQGGQGRGIAAESLKALGSDPHAAIKAFLNEHADLFGHGAEVLDTANVQRDYATEHNAMQTTVWEQQIDGIPVFEALLVGNVTKQGELISLSTHFLANANKAAEVGTPNRTALEQNPAVSIEQAVVNAGKNVGVAMDISDVKVVSQGSDAKKQGRFKVASVLNGEVYAHLVWLPMDANNLRLAWEILFTVHSTGERFDSVVDARSGDVLVRHALTRHLSDATYRVYTGDSPSPFSPGWPTPNTSQPAIVSRALIVTSAVNVVASPNGWIDDTNNETSGNNIDAFLDRDFDQQPDRQRPQGSPNRVFDFPLDLSQSPATYEDATIVNLFYRLNWYHDKVYELGFTEAAGNYQVDNFGRGGLGNDPIHAEAQSGADKGFFDNAFFSPSPDGIPPDIAMFLWEGPTPDRDGDLDSEVIMHEATHGTSERLVGAGVFITALQPAGMGEGWSDFYALSLLSAASDDPDATYPSGGYASYRLGGLTENYYFGIRHFPYSTDLTKNPFTLKDIDPTQISPHTGIPRSPIYPFDPTEADEVHHQGEIWCTALWEVRANLVRKYGFSGNQSMLQIVTDAMKLSPANPTFLQARDAIILADRVDNGGANIDEIWAGFAKRGMGVSASVPDSSTTVGVVEAFDIPGLSYSSSSVSGGNGNGIIDFNECDDLSIIITNNSVTPASGVSARLSTTTPGVAVVQTFSTYPNIPGGASAGNRTAYKISTTPTFVCGTPIDFALVIKTDLETRTNRFRLNSGTIGSPVRFDNNSDYSIPDATSAGVFSPITVSNITTAIGHVTASLFLTHTYDSDLRIELLAPDGTTVLLSGNHGGSGDNYGGSCSPDASRSSFDDLAPVKISGANAPFVGTFQPDQKLSIFNGKSGTNVNGIWQLHIVDEVAIDTGVLHCWSLAISPADCTDGGGECPVADLSIALQTVPAQVLVNSNFSYVMTISNAGPSTAKAVVVNQNLPSGVVFVTGSTSQGTLQSSGSAVSANLGNLAGGATATVTVIVVASATGVATTTATVGSTIPDFDLSNNSATLNTVVNPPSSDLAVTMTGAPDPVFAGGVLTYAVSVVNNGPIDASNVVVTNKLPATATFISASTSQGGYSYSSGTVFASLGNLPVGSNAVVTILVSPTTFGTITASAQVASAQSDPIPGNNTATATTTVTPAADLAVRITDTPDPIVVGSNLTYVVTVTNRGPSTANGVVLNDIVPNNVTILSMALSQGTLSNYNNNITANLGTLISGGSATLTMVVTTPRIPTTLTSIASVSAIQADPFMSDNTFTAQTTVAPPVIIIAGAGATLTAESISPPNGAVDPGETVTVQLRLQNVGNIPNTNLVATLLATNGVMSPSSAQTYGLLPPGALPVSRPFTFTAAGSNGGTVVATLQLQDGSKSLGVASFTFALPTVITFANTNFISINDTPTPPTKASLYPSSIFVSGVTSLVSKISVTLSNVSHTYPDDIDALLVHPSGRKSILMSDAGGPNALVNQTITFDKTAAVALPDEDQIVTANYRPADYESGDVFPDAPAGPYSASLGLFDGIDPNGFWSLYIMDDTGGDAGSIAGGWKISITTVTPVNQIADIGIAASSSPNPVLAGDNLTYTYVITNAGPDAASNVSFTNVLPASFSFVSLNVSQGSVLVSGQTNVCNLGGLAVGGSATVTVIVLPASAGTIDNAASVGATEIDLAPANNSLTSSTVVASPVADMAVSITGPSQAILGSNVTYTVLVVNNGPNAALNAALADALPAGMNFVSATSTRGTVSNVGNSVNCNLGTLPSGSSATITVIANAAALGSLTNLVGASTTSSDSDSANNYAIQATLVTPPMPVITAAGSRLLSESFVPANGSIDSGESVGLSFTLANTGTAPTTNLTATVLLTGGVTSASAAQNYGTINPGSSGSANYVLSASGPNGGAITVTLALANNGSALGNITYTFLLPNTQTFTNSGAIIIPEVGPATPYPSTISVSATGLVSKVTAKLNRVTHNFPDDIDVMLVSPAGQKLVLMSDAGGSHSITNVMLDFADTASSTLPDSSQVVSGSYLPTDYQSGDTFPAVSGGPDGSALAVFNGTNPNGSWALYVVDDAPGDGGSIGAGGVVSNSWSLTVTTVNPINPAANLSVSISGPSVVYSANFITYTVTAGNAGPSTAPNVAVSDHLPSNLVLVSATSSQGTCNTNTIGLVTCNLGDMPSGASATITIVARSLAAGTAINTASVSSDGLDLYPANNTAQFVTTVFEPTAATLFGYSVRTNGAFQLSLRGQAGQIYALQASTNLISWTDLVTNTAGTDGTFLFNDTSATNSRARYYRAVRLPQGPAPK